jgi:DNA-binding MarR family transcriptional regulator
VGALAEGAGIAQPTATRMLDGLERQGIVERRPSTADRRSVEVELTARGRRLLNRKRKLVDEKRQAVFESLEAADRESAARLLRTLAAAIEDQL